ncbi:hypothetical protein Mapa_003418 [Marchantia paleacea]|nr:hypothetical protein Mapa_003418 [Marchantia paleacea]
MPITASRPTSHCSEHLKRISKHSSAGTSRRKISRIQHVFGSDAHLQYKAPAAGSRPEIQKLQSLANAVTQSLSPVPSLAAFCTVNLLLPQRFPICPRSSALVCLSSVIHSVRSYGRFHRSDCSSPVFEQCIRKLPLLVSEARFSLGSELLQLQESGWRQSQFGGGGSECDQEGRDCQPSRSWSCSGFCRAGFCCEPRIVGQTEKGREARGQGQGGEAGEVVDVGCISSI